mgnify:CR=1 FL=1
MKHLKFEFGEQEAKNRSGEEADVTEDDGHPVVPEADQGHEGIAVLPHRLGDPVALEGEEKMSGWMT